MTLKQKEFSDTFTNIQVKHEDELRTVRENCAGEAFARFDITLQSATKKYDAGQKDLLQTILTLSDELHRAGERPGGKESPSQGVSQEIEGLKTQLETAQNRILELSDRAICIEARYKECDLVSRLNLETLEGDSYHILITPSHQKK